MTPGPEDETRALPPDRAAPADRTAPLPPGLSAPPAWSGRAEVPSPRPEDYREPADWYAEEAAGRPWWLPILWGVLALLLLALLGGGLWLALRSADDEPAPPVTPSVSPTRASPRTEAPTTSAAPTTGSPSAAPTTAAAEVPMPPVVNLPLATAQAILDRTGLAYEVEYRISDRPAGTVLETDPEAGEPVSEDEEVTLVVSRGEPTPESPTGTASAEPTPTG
ncbi:PASTA domain-containing protein [Micromonospora endolithica]|uniref:PASTA domain-containing protein n=1 Tax=Micromonospora endolithica TaxID=230091 RepID=A0A3A9ZE07_9ACTN|nr:PASTA domain-containing protein [Micromonospora endolithica]RKN46500.1 PASTA domain-containing protein [Micromonospora endolithica]TWJ24866.1 PASTA domain-containing protein [Micromonospora endolithica]